MPSENSCTICMEDVINYPAPSGAEATGSHLSSCGHLFHPKCIWKWYSKQAQRTCPMCRNPATEMEDALSSSESEEEYNHDEDYDDGGEIQIHRIAMDAVMRSQGGIGVTDAVAEEVVFDYYNEVIITRYEFERLLGEQGCSPFSQARWEQLMTIYPVPDEVLAQVPSVAVVSNNHTPLGLSTDSALAFESLQQEEAELMTRVFSLVSGAQQSTQMTFTRDSIQNLLERHGSIATMSEFFNEEDGEEEIKVVTMTFASLNARFSSLGAMPVSFAEASASQAESHSLVITVLDDGTREVIPYTLLNS